MYFGGMGRLAWSLGLAGLVLGGPGVALAAPPAKLKLTTGEGVVGCPTEDALAARVDELAQKPVFNVPGPKSIVVSVEITAVDQGFAAVVELSGATRTIEDSGPGCQVLSEALAVTIGILLDVDTKPPIRRDDEPAPAPKKTEEEPEPDVRLTGSLGGFYDFGTLEDSAGGLSLGLDLLVPYVSFGLAMLGLPQDPTELESDGANYRFAAGRFRACARNPFSGQFGAALCSGFTVGERTLDPGASGGFAGALLQLEISRRVVGPFGVFADLGLTFPFWDEPLDVGQPLKDQPVTFQFGVGARFWIAPYP
jgi:hypothetical protein